MKNTGYISSSSTDRVFSSLGYGIATGNGTTSTITSGGLTYTLLSFTTDGVLTVSSAGLFEFLLVGGGGGAGNCCWRSPAPTTAACGAGGGGGGVMGFDQTLSIYLPATTYSMDVGLGGSPFGDANSYCYAWGMPGRPTRVATTAGILNNVIIEALGGGGGAGQQYVSSSEYMYFIGRSGANGGGTTWTTGPYFQGEGLSYDYANRAGALDATGYVGYPTGRRGGGGSIANDQSNNYGGGGAGASGRGLNGTSGVGGGGGTGVDIASWIGSPTAFVVGAGGGGGGNNGGGTAAPGGVAGRSGSANGNDGVNPGAGGGGTCANSSNRRGGLGAPGAIYVRFRTV